jgi:hypothetical protein
MPGIFRLNKPGGGNMRLYEQTLGRSRSVSQYAQENLYYCDRAGYFGGNPDFQVDRDYLHDYLFIFVRSGVFHLESGDWNGPVSSGQTAIINLQEKHRYYSDRHDPCEILWMDFYGAPDLMKPLTSLAALPLIFRDPANMTLMNDFVYQYVHNSRFTEAAQSSAIYRLLISAIACLTNGQPAGLKQLVAVEDYINKNIQSRITLIELANVLHISPDHFAHLFKQQYGWRRCIMSANKKSTGPDFC